MLHISMRFVRLVPVCRRLSACRAGKSNFLCVLHVSKRAIQLVSVGQSLATCAQSCFKRGKIQCLVFFDRLAQVVPSDVIQGKHRLLETKVPEGMCTANLKQVWCYRHVPWKYKCVKPRISRPKGTVFSFICAYLDGLPSQDEQADV